MNTRFSIIGQPPATQVPLNVPERACATLRAGLIVPIQARAVRSRQVSQ